MVINCLLYTSQVLLHLNYMSTPLMGVVYFIYTLTTVFEQDADKLKKHILFAGIPALFYLLCLLSNPLTHLLFTLDPIAGYVRGLSLIHIYLRLSYQRQRLR